MRQAGLTLATAALSVLACTAGARAAPETRTFRDWLAGCDNLGNCTALSLPDEASQTIGFLKLERAAGPDGAPALSLRLSGDDLKEPLPVQLKLDGQRFPPAGPEPQARLEDVETAVLAFSEADTAALVEAARKATKLEATLAGKGYAVSLSGAVAALLWIDEQQGRLGTVTALIRKGPAAAGTVPAPRPVPVIAARSTKAEPALSAQETKALTTALRRQVTAKSPDLCDDPRPGFNDADIAFRLSPTTRLVGLFCGAGAYNVTTGYWLVDGTNVQAARPLSFPKPFGDGGNILVNADYDPASGEISFFAKGRGIGDCGSAGSFAWTGRGFVPTAFSTMPECRLLNADNWLTLFRSEVKTAP